MFYAKSTGGFYDTAIHGDNIPSDAVEIVSEEHFALLQGQSEGKLIVSDEHGKPVLTDQPKATSDQVWLKIKAERDHRSEAGCMVAGHWFHNDLKSRSQWERMANRAVLLADADPYLVDGVQVAWKTMSGEFVQLTAGLIRQVVDAFEVHEVATFKSAETNRAAMETSGDPSAYDYSSGWPEIYQEP